MLRNTLAGSKPVVSISRNDPVSGVFLCLCLCSLSELDKEGGGALAEVPR